MQVVTMVKGDFELKCKCLTNTCREREREWKVILRSGVCVITKGRAPAEDRLRLLLEEWKTTRTTSTWLQFFSLSLSLERCAGASDKCVISRNAKNRPSFLKRRPTWSHSLWCKHDSPATLSNIYLLGTHTHIQSRTGQRSIQGDQARRVAWSGGGSWAEPGNEIDWPNMRMTDRQ